jgi:O-antigen/teichoic acid export membrane protein
MGVIQKQTIKGSTWSYIGAILGFVNTGLLFPKIFSTSEIGLLSVIVAISALFSQFSSLGMNSVTARLFPYFKEENKSKVGYLSLLLVVTTIGFLLSMAVGVIFKDWIIETRSADSGLLNQYAFYLIPMTLFTLFFNLFDTYNKMLYDITSGIFLKEFLLRVLNFISIFLFFFGWIDFNLFVLLYVVSYFVPLLGLFLILLFRGELSVSLGGFVLTKEMKREIFLVAAFGILAGFSGIISDYLDKYLVNKYMGLSNTGIYTIAFYIGTMILLPSRALNKISSTLIAECWKVKDMATISDIYRKSSINQFAFALLFFVMIITNLHNIFGFLPAKYSDGKWVLILISITNLIIMFSGVSYSIISTASYYWYMSALMGIQIVMIVATNILLIPVLGMTGAAIATLISISVIRLGSMVIIGIKSSIWPFSLKHLLVIGISLLVVGVVSLIPEIPNIYVDGIIRGGLITVIFGILVLKFNISDELTIFYERKLSKNFKKRS